jgi:hypothetical protein
MRVRAVAVEQGGDVSEARAGMRPSIPASTTNVGGVVATAGMAVLNNDEAATTTPARHLVARRPPEENTPVVRFKRELNTIVQPPIWQTVRSSR